ncbi:MAG TPA: HEAT repeat domain-containing protein [Chloroflexota bacterium]|nr:HEAT repeat domain-containing protein [Chloroflexota bacterium]
MPAFINRLFNIRREEWPRVLLLFLMAFLAVTGITWGKLTVQPLFWQVVGVDRLGFNFIVEGVAAIVLVALYSPFADRLNHGRLLWIIALGSATAVLIGWYLLVADYQAAGVFLLYPLFTVIPFILNLHWWTYVTGFYDARAAKRIVPVLASNARLAGAFAGFSVGFLTRWLGSSEAVIALWALALLVMAGLVWLSPYILRGEGDTATSATLSAGVTPPSPTTTTISFSESLREGYRYVMASPYLRWLAMATLLVSLLLILMKFESSRIIDSAFGSHVAATNFLGNLEGWANLLLLPVQIFLLSRLINKMGLHNANLIFPVGTASIAGGLLIFIFLSLTPGIVILGSLAYLSANVLNTTFRNPIDNLLYNAVPLRMKGRARAFVNGLLVPTASLVGGLLLLLPFITGIAWVLPVLLVVVAGVYLGAAWRVSRQYTSALVTMLEQEDYSFLLGQEVADVTVTDPAALEWLRERLEQSQSDEMTLFMVTLISEVGGDKAVPVLADVARSRDAHMRAAVLDILAAVAAPVPAVHDFFAEFLADEDARVRRSALAGLERVDGAQDTHYLAAAARMLDDSDTAVRLQALPGLLRYGDLAQREQALRQVQMMLASEESVERAAALRALGQTEDVGYVGNVIRMLPDSSDRVRLEAALVLEQLSTQKLPAPVAEQVTQGMSDRLHDPVERTREASLVTLARLGDQRLYPLLAETLNDNSPQLRATAVTVLTGLGKKVIPTVHPLLDSPNPQLRKMATVILGRINRREYGPLVTAQVQANLLQIAENAGYIEALTPIKSYTAVNVLLTVFQNENSRLLDEIFFLLTAVQRPESVAVIRESLASDVERVQANAIEALESLTSAQTAEMIAPIARPQASLAEIRQISQELWDMKFPSTAEAMEKLATDLAVDPWPRSIAVYALGEIGQAMVAPQGANPQASTPPKPEEPPVADGRDAERRPRRRRADVLDMLIEDGDAISAGGDTPPAESNPVDARQARRERAARASGLLDDLVADEPTPAPPTPAALETVYYPPPTVAKSIPITRVLAWLQAANLAPEEEVRLAVQRANERMAGKGLTPALSVAEVAVPYKEGAMLSTIERIIFLKEVLFFREMTVDQLKVLASVCEEAFYTEDGVVYKEGDPGGQLYVVVQGRVSIERESRKGVVARLATIEAYSYFGEMNLFDASARTDTAVALQDTLTLTLRREPLIALARQHPDLSLELINVLSQRLRETTDQVARLTKSHPRALHKVLDQLE